MQFAEGTHVTYKDHTGYISFICDASLSICIAKGAHPSQDVNIVVYRQDFKKIELYKQSQK